LRPSAITLGKLFFVFAKIASFIARVL